MVNFDKVLKTAKWEYGYLHNLTTNTVGKTVTSFNERDVNVNESIIGFEDGDEIATSHCHLSGTPFNHKDVTAILNVKVNVSPRFLVVHTKENVFIAEFNKKAFNNKTEIIKELSEEYGNGLLNTDKSSYDAIWDNYINNKILTKYITFRRISK